MVPACSCSPRRPAVRRVRYALGGLVAGALISCTSPEEADSEPAGPATEEPEHRSLDDALRQGLSPLTNEQLQELADFWGVEQPPDDVTFERYISPDEYAEVMVPCLSELGLPVTALPDGGISFGQISPNQAELQRESMFRCTARFPTHPLYEQPLNPEQLRFLYDYMVNELVPCLEDEGYATSPAPDVDAFIAGYADPDKTWSPYPADEPRLHDPDEWYRLSEVCPQTPPLEELYGR